MTRISLELVKAGKPDWGTAKGTWVHHEGLRRLGVREAQRMERDRLSNQDVGGHQNEFDQPWTWPQNCPSGDISSSTNFVT